MTISTIEQEILDEVRQMTPAQQREALEMLRKMNNKPLGLSGEETIRIAREINFPREDLEEMERAIEEEFGFRGFPSEVKNNDE